ncbi:hypothetical protein NCCP2495_05300 [Dietzia sp. NCCP-2495]|uniref:hypothetical protein n=1 Tax=Dietzia sp. NCCP-2495 TaxID=2934675 RepID=UPI00222F43E0|nr:hypothetical protein [Dietzia sp. NCCP-2495]GLB62652.1 hypothetical protein NCCP2495_05300 [Dietzia sp. NCCP-2495]
MAIQVWDEQTQQYRGVELARYGSDGTLAEALVWAGGQYRKVWPPVVRWSDDFTSPTLHERWTLISGDYTPPGLSAEVLGPAVTEAFEVSHSKGGNAATSVAVIDESFSNGILVDWSSGITVFDMATFQSLIDLPNVAPTSRVGLRRTGGQWELLLDGSVAGSAPDTHIGVGLSLYLQGATAAPITQVAYTEL